MVDAVRLAADEYRRLELRSHSLLADVPLHDAWAVDLDGGGPGRTVADVRALVTRLRPSAASVPVRFLFGLRWMMGRLLGWDRVPTGAAEASYIHRLTPEDRARSTVAPGSPDGFFTLLYSSADESISEIHNATVHAFSVFALRERPGGYRLTWSIYVRPVGRLTAAYMALIDPFRRWIIYPALMRSLQSAWAREVATP